MRRQTKLTTGQNAMPNDPASTIADEANEALAPLDHAITRMSDNMNGTIESIRSAKSRIRDTIKTLHDSAYTDSITLIFNNNALKKLTKLFDRKYQLGGAVFVDLTGFKKINDSYGHEAGDSALRAAGSKLKEIGAFFGATVFRKGGDEFVLLVQAASSTESCAQTVSKDFSKGFDREFTTESKTVILRIQGAVGFSTCQDEETTLTTLIDQADNACRRAKFDDAIQAYGWDAAIDKAGLLDSKRMRCRHCQSTTSLLFKIDLKKPDALSRCANCGNEYPPEYDGHSVSGASGSGHQT
jgi:diguanylate cyclase (GGDEF)-like protein